MRNNKGFTQIDIVISVIILMLFATLIATLFYNSFNSSSENRKDAESAAYLTQIFQSIDLIEYDNLQDANEGILAKIDAINEDSQNKKISGEYVQNIDAQTSLSTPYRAQVKIENYTPSVAQQYDLVKIITIKLSYKNQKGDPLIARRLKTRDIEYEDSKGIIPNLYENSMVPITYDNENQATTKYASNWFNYSDEKVAEISLKDAIFSATGAIEGENYGSRFVYVPRFAYMVTRDNNDNQITKIKFLNTDNTCKDGSSTTINKETALIEEEKYYVPDVFTQNNVELQGIWLGKYLVRKKTDAPSSDGTQIYVTDQESQIWTGLTNEQKLSEIAEMTEDDNNYELTNDVTIKLVDTSINGLLEKLAISNYSFISDAIEEDETNYSGSFRIYMY